LQFSGLVIQLYDLSYSCTIQLNAVRFIFMNFPACPLTFLLTPAFYQLVNISHLGTKLCRS